MKTPTEDNNEDLGEQTTTTLDQLKGAAHERVSSTSENPLFRSGNSKDTE